MDVKFYFIKPKNFFLMLVLSMAIILVGCAGTKTKSLERSEKIPAATGKVEYKTTENNNTKVKIEVFNLAPPSRVKTGATTYVVWAQPITPNTTAQNIGALKVDDDLHGELETLVPYKEFDLFITASPSSTADFYNTERLLQVRIVNE
ncbi:MAG: hypothetical protein HQK51_11070 [Oligoflexia bacterium]|nr:hypothetical protein [Oligoflexia bacterium]